MALNVKLTSISIGKDEHYKGEVATAVFSVLPEPTFPGGVTVVYGPPADDGELVRKAWSVLHAVSSEIAEVAKGRMG